MVNVSNYTALAPCIINIRIGRLLQVLVINGVYIKVLLILFCFETDYITDACIKIYIRVY